MRLFRGQTGRVLTQPLPLFVCAALIVAVTIAPCYSAEAPVPELTVRLQTLGIGIVESALSDTALRVVFDSPRDRDEMLAMCSVLRIASEYAPKEGLLEVVATRSNKPLFQVRTRAANVEEFINRNLARRRQPVLEQLPARQREGRISRAQSRRTEEIVINPDVEAPREKKAQASAEDIACALVALYLENVQVAWQHNGDLNVRFENRTYRSDAAALGKILGTIAGMVEPDTLVRVLALRDEVVLGRFTCRAQAYQELQAPEVSAGGSTPKLDTDLDLQRGAWPQTLREATPRLNSSRGRFDLLLRPALEYRIGGELDPWESTPLLKPELTVGLGKGLRASARGRAVLDQWGWSVDRALLSKVGRAGNASLLWTASVGKFRHRRYGGFFEGQWIDSSDRTRLGTRLAVLGLDFGHRHFEMLTGYIEREFGELGLTARATCGNFLEFREKGYLLELERRFGETTLRLAGTRGLATNRLLLRLSLPFGGPRQGQPRGLRVRPSSSFELDYGSTTVPVGDAMWDTPDLRSFRGELTLPYTSSHPERLVEALARPVDGDEWRVAPSFEGITGLIRTPTADVIPDGHYVLGCSWIPKEYTSGVHQGKSRSRPTYASVGFLPNLELNFRFTFYDDVTAQFPGVVTQWPYDLDRSFSAQYQAWRQKGGRPALAVGMQDIKFGDDSPKVGRAQYAVASHQFDDLRLHLGIGRGRYQGLFGGIEARLSDRIKLMGEYDTNNVNLGLRLHLSHGLTLDAAWPDTTDFGAAVSYQGAFP